MTFRKTLKSALLVLLLSATTAAAETLTDRERAILCQNAVVHTPADDVAYTPGVATDGTAVAPADLPQAGITLSDRLTETITLQLRFDLAERLGLTLPEGFSGDLDLGTLTIENDQALFNGEPLTDTQTTRLQALCQAAD